MKRAAIAAFGVVALAFPLASRMGANEPESERGMVFSVHQIGQVKKSGDRTVIVLDKKYQPALLGLDGYSHLYLFWWFDRNDTPEKRSTLQVRPMGIKENPITGVFATRSPARPNLIALTLCEIVSVKENIVEIKDTDAFDGTPVLDIKPFIPGYDTTEGAKVPDWLTRSRKQRAAKSTASGQGPRKLKGD